MSQIDPESLYYDLRATIEAKGYEIPDDADEALSDAARAIAQSNDPHNLTHLFDAIVKGGGVCG